MFEIDRFVEDCRVAMKDTDSTKAVREVVAEAVADPDGLIKVLGEPARGTVNTLYRSEDLTIINPIWAPRMTVMPRYLLGLLSATAFGQRLWKVHWRCFHRRCWSLLDIAQPSLNCTVFRCKLPGRVT